MAGKKDKRTSVCTLQIHVNYDPRVTDPEAIASATSNLLDTALGTPDVLDECGNPAFGEFEVAIGPDADDNDASRD